MSNLREMHLFHMALYHLTPAIRLILINNDFLPLLAFLILKLVMSADQTLLQHLVVAMNRLGHNS